MPKISIREMLEAGVHFGHQTDRWHPKMKPYIYTARNGIHIINLKLTVEMFDKAYEVVRDVIASGESIIFVGTKKQAQDVVREQAERTEMYYVINRWLGGTLTNFRTIRQSIEKFNELQKMAEEGTYNVRTKKEVLKLEKKRQRMAKNFSGIASMTKLPGILFLVDPEKDHNAVLEAKKLGIPVVALCDTNVNPELIDYPIPANDDAVRSIKLFVSKIADAVLEGKGIYEASIREAAEQSVSQQPKGPSGVKVKKARLGKRDDRRKKSEAYAEPSKKDDAADEASYEIEETLDKKRYSKQKV